MRLVWVVISGIFIGSCCGRLEEDNTNQIRCGVEKFCVPPSLCQEEETDDSRNVIDVCAPTMRCCHVDGETSDSELDVPYLGTFAPESFVVGKSIRIQGLVLQKLPEAEFTEIFFVRLQSGQDFWPKPKIAFELTDRHAIFTSAGERQRKEFNQTLPREKSFHLDVVRGESSYKVYVNKQLLVEIPIQGDAKVMDTLYVSGDIQLWEVVVENFSPTIPSKKGLYLFKNIGVLKEGVSFIVTGYILPNCNRFAINLGADKDIALHVNPRYDEGTIVFNTYVNMNWTEPGQLDCRMPSSLRLGSRFTCQILVTGKSYMIAMNGRHVFEFEHRLPYTSLSHIEVAGDIANVHFKRNEVSQYPQRLKESDVDKISEVTD